MSKASRRTGAGTPDPAERVQSWTAALVTALLHALLLLLVMLAPPIDVTQPQQGGAAGGRLQVTWIDETPRPPLPAPVPDPGPRLPRERVAPMPTASRVQATTVEQADDSRALRVVDIPAGPPEPEPSNKPQETARRPAQAWGQPPGMLPEDLAPVNAGPARSRGTSRSRRNDAASSGTSLEVGGYQVYYDLLDETRLRGWRDEGMTELFLPLPGTRRLMVCPLEIALHRDSGACRLVEPDDPELETIGDARDVITMQRVYRLGEVLWSGPGAYR